jgi:hypothetical protein
MPADTEPASAERRTVHEILELGEFLFDTVMDAAVASGEPAARNDDSFPEQDLRAAAAEFFTALRLLLRVEEGD